MRWSLLLSLVALCGAQTFTRFEGKRPDPCTRAVAVAAPAVPAECPVTARLPFPATTILLPSASSNQAADATVASVLGGSFQVTMQGANFGPSATIPLRLSSTPGGTCTAGTDAANAVTGTAGATGTTLAFTIPMAWTTVQRELEVLPRALCYQVPGTTMFAWTGYWIGVAWNCDEPTATNTVPATLQCGQSLPARVVPLSAADAAAGYQGLTSMQILERAARTTCCKGTVTTGRTLRIGQCVNPRVQSCCGGAAVEFTVNRCCSAPTEVVQSQQLACPCYRSTNVTDCPTAETCCSPTKYPEFANPPASTGLRAEQEALGDCFNPSFYRCCDTGSRFDPGVQQCCVINGLQTLDVPCPCSVATDCWGGHTTGPRTTTQVCCEQTLPAPRELGTEACTIYANFPTGTGPYQAQRCLGNCMDPAWQICCNGVICRREYERCCNSTCCNRFTGTCAVGFRPGTVGNSNNWVNLFETVTLANGTVSQRRVRFEICTTKEQLDVIKSFFIFVLPTFLLATTVLGLAAVLAFANKASARSYSFLERAMIVVAVLAVIFALPFFFSPGYRYAVWIIIVAFVAILTAAGRLKWLNILAVILLAVTLLYVIDPFAGNMFWTFNPQRVTGGAHLNEGNGLFHLISFLWRSIATPVGAIQEQTTIEQRFCTNYYNYFCLDRLLLDRERFDNPDVPTFGYCSRGWITALLIFGAILLLLVGLLALLALLAVILRFKEESSYEPIELEVRGTGSRIGSYEY